MQRNRKSLLNAISAVFLTVCNGLFGIVFVKFVLIYFGSDFNGLNSTANQFVSILMLFEGGFTIATNVALFKPYSDRDFDSVNAIISATNHTFKRAGILSLMIGTILSTGYAFVINSALPRWLVFSVVFMTILPTCFNFYFATKYRILLQAEQKEYIISFITLVTSSLGYIVNIAAMYLGCDMWFIRFCTMLFSLLNSILIGLYVRKKFTFINFHVKPNHVAIVGTKDVFAQKLTGVFYSTMPILSITLTAGGTMLASVYAVYSSVFVMLKGILRAVIDAPRLSIGELAAQSDEENVWKIYQQYETITFILIFIFLTTASVLIMPFISIYTKDISDINYNQPLIAVLLILITYFELLHIPSGHLMNMTGNFRISKNLQIIATAILTIGFAFSFLLHWGIYGILASVLVTAIYLCIAEIVFIHSHYFKEKLSFLLKINIPLLILGIVLIYFECLLIPTINGYFGLLLTACVVFIINTVFSFLFVYLWNKECAKNIVGIVLTFTQKNN